MKFRIKVTLCMISLIGIIFGIGGTMLIYISFQNSIDREKLTAQKSFNMILNTMLLVNETSVWTSSADIADSINKIIAQNDCFNGVVLSDQDEIVYESGDITKDFENITSYADSSTIACKNVKSDTGYFIQLCGAINVGSKPMYLNVGYDITSVYQQRNEQQRAYVITFITMIVLGAAFSYILSYLMTKPLVELKNVASEISEGNYEVRSLVNSNDEIGLLAKQINNMTDTLVERMDELNEVMERQNRFISDFTHELKTPMTSIIGYADLLRSQTLNGDDSIDAANYIFSESKRLENLSNKMLEIVVAGKDTIEMSIQEPAVLIENVVEHYRYDFQKTGINIVTKLENGICILEPDFFTSLIINLLENSRRAMEKGGTITIILTMSDKGCLIEVNDTGSGIPKEKLAHLTEAFYRVDKARSRSFGGLGLGLHLCDKIVKLHNGNLNIESQVGIGTTVTVELMGGRA